MFRLTIAMLMMLCPAGTALAQNQNCGDRDQIVTQLQERWGETRQNMGLNQGNSIVEVFVSDTTGTWTILVTIPDGTSCLIAAGENWEQVAGELLPSGSPA
jgi:hypothetical protein